MSIVTTDAESLAVTQGGQQIYNLSTFTPVNADSLIFSTNENEDIYSVSLNANEYYSFIVQYQNVTNATLTPLSVAIYSDENTEVVNGVITKSFGENGVEVSVLAQNSGTYYLSIQGGNSIVDANSQNVEYDISVHSFGTTPPIDTSTSTPPPINTDASTPPPIDTSTSTPPPIDNGGGTTGTTNSLLSPQEISVSTTKQVFDTSSDSDLYSISNMDSDYYSVALKAGTVYQFSISTDNINANFNANVSSSAMNISYGGMKIESWDYLANSKTLNITYVAPSDGSYTISVNSNSENATFNYAVSTQELGLAEEIFVRDTLQVSTQSTTFENQSSNGELPYTIGDKSDIDYYKFDVEALHKYEIAIQKGSYNENINISILNSKGQMIEIDTYMNNNIQYANVEAMTADTYTVLLSSKSSQLYNISVSDGGTFEDVSQGIIDFNVDGTQKLYSTTEESPTNFNLTSEVIIPDANFPYNFYIENDWEAYKVSLEAGKTYQFTVSYNNPTSDIQLGLDVYNTDGIALMAKHEETVDANTGQTVKKLSFVASSTSDYYISIDDNSNYTASSVPKTIPFVLSTQELAQGIELIQTSLDISTTQQEKALVSVYDEAGKGVLGLDLVANNKYTFTFETSNNVRLVHKDQLNSDMIVKVLNQYSSDGAYNNKTLLYAMYDNNGAFYVGDTQYAKIDDNTFEISFTPLSSGKYYMIAKTDYTTTATDNAVMKYVDSGTNTDVQLSQAQELIVDAGVYKSSQTYTIAQAGEMDIFKIELTADTQYSFKLNSDASNSLDLKLLDSSFAEQFLPSIYDINVDDSISFVASKSGTYYLVVSSNSNQIANYSITTMQLDESNNTSTDKYGDNISQAEALSFTDGKITVSDDNLDSWSDYDYFKVALVAGKEYHITVDTSSNDSFSPYFNTNIISGMSKDGNYEEYVWDGVNYNWNSDYARDITFVPTESKDYYIKLSGYSTANYTLEITQGGVADAHGNTLAEAFALSFNGNEATVSDGKLHSWSDKDWFKITLDAGVEYTITLDTDNNSYINMGVITGMQQYSYGNYTYEYEQYADGVTYDWNSTFDKEVSFVPSESREYYIKVDGSVSNYQLKVSKGDVADIYGNDVANATKVEFVNGVIDISSKLHSWSDTDVIKVSLEAGYAYTVVANSKAWWLGVDVKDANGNYIWDGKESNWNSTDDVNFVFTANATKDYYFAIDGDADEYSFKMTKSAEKADDYSNKLADAYAISVNSPLIGKINKSWDNDYFKVDLEAGKRYEVIVNSTDLVSTVTNYGYSYTQRDFGVTLFDTTANSANDWDTWSHSLYWEDGVSEDWQYNSGIKKYFEVSQTGTYYINVNGWDKKGSYSLEVKESSIQDDYGANTSTKGIIATPTSATEAITVDGKIDYEQDQDWFKIELAGNKIYNFGIKSNSTTTTANTIGTTANYSWNNISIMDSEGKYIWEDLGYSWVDGQSIVSLTTKAQGTYYIQANGSVGGYKIKTTMQELVADDYGDTKDTAHKLAFDGANTITLQGANISTLKDVDYFSIALSHKNTYNLYLDSTVISKYDLFANIVDTNGNNLYWNDGVKNEWDSEKGSYISFTPTKDAIYYISVDSYGSIGTYNLTVAKEEKDEVGNYTDTNATITANQTIQSALNSNNDTDWFKFSAVAGETYSFELNSATLSYPSLNIIDHTGMYLWNEVNYDWNASVDSKINFTASQDGDYFVAVNGWQKGKYDLSMKKLEIVDDFGSSITKHGEITQGNSITGTLETNWDKDWFVFTAIAGSTYAIELNTESTNDWPWLNLFDATGMNVWDGVSWDWSSNADNKIYFKNNSSSDKQFYIAVGGNESTKYTLSLDEYVFTDDYGASVSEHGDFSVIDTDQNGIIEANKEVSADKDWFKVSVTDGKMYEVTLNSTTMNYAWLEVLDNAGYGVWENITWDWSANGNTGDTNSKLYINAKSTTDYFVSVSGWESGAYSLGFKEVSITDDYGSSITSFGTFNSTNERKSGNLEASYDSDWFKFSAISGETYEIVLNSDTMKWAWLNIMDNLGYYAWDGISYEYSNSADAKIIFQAKTTANYFIAVDSTETGAYDLDLTKITVTDDYGSTTTDAGVFATIDSDNNGSITGTLENSFDLDWFKVSLQSGMTYEITLDSSVMQYSYLNIMDKYGNWIWNGISYLYGSGKDSQILFTPTTTDTYYVSVDAWETGSYTLDIKEATLTDDYSAGVSTVGSIALNGNSSGTIEKIGDKDWFKFSFTESGTYVFTLTSKTSTAKIDTIIDGIYNSEGLLIGGTYNDDVSGTNSDSKVSLNIQTADYANKYVYVAVSSWDTGDYLLSATKLSQTDTVASDSSTTARFVKNETTGIWEYSSKVDFAYDKDWVAVTLTGGVSYDVALSGLTLNDSYIYGIYDANSTLIANTTNNDASAFTLNSLVTFTPSTTGTYYVNIGSADSNIGTYDAKISVHTSTTNTTDALNNDINNTKDTAIEGSLGKYISGTVDYSGDKDWYSVTLYSGKEYQINMMGDSTSSGTLINPYIYNLYDANGNKIAQTSNDDGGIDLNAMLSYTPSVTGTYYIEVGSADSSVGTYEVKFNEVVTASDHVEANTAKSSWTIMIYLAADNNLESFALDDLNEMEFANLPDDITVTFLLDRTDGYSTLYGDWKGTKQGLLSNDSDMFSLASSMEDIGEKNTGDQQTLTDFINWSAKMASADNYALVVWNHGGGISGSAWDDTNGSDNLKINEVTKAIQASNVTSFDVVGFDACLQGVIDQSYALKDVADVVVGSEDLEPGDGWDYTNWFNTLTEINDTKTNGADITSSELAKAIVDTYGDFYQTYPFDTTLSAIDTSKIDDVITSLKDLNDSLKGISQLDKSSISKAMDTEVIKFGDFTGYSYIDVGSLVKSIDELNITGSGTTTVDAYATTALTAINSAIIANTSSAGASGISMFYSDSAKYQDLYTENFEVAQNINVDSLYSVLA